MVFQSRQSEKKHFNQLAAAYESLYDMDKPAAKNKIRNLSRDFSSWLAGAAPGPLLEIGAGTGFYTRNLNRHITGRKYIASDISIEMIKIAKATMESDNNVIWEAADCLSLPFPDRTVACVTGHGIIHHLSVEQSVAEISRVLKRGGRIAFYEPNILNPYVFLVKTVPAFRPAGDTPDESAINPFSLAALLKQYSFHQINIIPCEFTMNCLPEHLVSPVEKLSRFLEKLPILRFMGGSLRITAEIH